MRPKQLVHTWVEAFNRADVATLAALYTENAVNHQVAESPIQGRENIRQMFAAEFARAAMHCVVENLFEDGDWAILEWRDPRVFGAVASFISLAARSHSKEDTETSFLFYGSKGCRYRGNKHLLNSRWSGP
jgi:SnoaL-like domain